MAVVVSKKNKEVKEEVKETKKNKEVKNTKKDVKKEKNNKTEKKEVRKNNNSGHLNRANFATPKKKIPGWSITPNETGTRFTVEGPGLEFSLSNFGKLWGLCGGDIHGLMKFYKQLGLEANMLSTNQMVMTGRLAKDGTTRAESTGISAPPEISKKQKQEIKKMIEQTLNKN